MGCDAVEWDWKLWASWVEAELERTGRVGLKKAMGILTGWIEKECDGHERDAYGLGWHRA